MKSKKIKEPSVPCQKKGQKGQTQNENQNRTTAIILDRNGTLKYANFILKKSL
jgi:hypothetical protein